MLAPVSVKLLLPSLTRPPLPVSVPAKLLAPPLPLRRVWVFNCTVPAPARVPVRWSPPSASVALSATVTAGRALRRSAAASVSVPPDTSKLVAALLPVRRLMPVDAKLPAPSVAPAVPPSSA